MLSKRNIYSIGIATIIFLIGLFIINLVWGRPFFIKHFFYKEMIIALKNDPQTASKARAPFFYKKSRDRLNDISAEGIQKRAEHLVSYSDMLSRYNDKFLSHKNRISKQFILWHLEMEKEGMDFRYHEYPLNPYNGYQVKLPGYLDTYHSIRNRKDALAYLERLSLFPEYFRQLKNRMELAKQNGIIPPARILDQSIDQMEGFIRIEPENNILYLSFKSKIDSLKGWNNKEALLEKNIELISNEVYPAYENLLIYTRKLKKEVKVDIGVSALPDGKNYYQFLLQKHTSLDIDADSLYTLGVTETQRIKDEIVENLNEMGVNADLRNVMDEVRELSHKPEWLLGNSIQGRLECKKIVDSLIEESNSFIKNRFNSMPESGIQLKRVPVFRESWTPTAYYEIPTLDGEGNGTYYLRMDVLDDLSLNDLPSLTHHEVYPGHHYQLASNLESKDIPLYRKRFYNNGFLEGWAMYAELLMFEFGYYNDKPFANLGRLQGELLRAARMVTDIGIHHKGWSRENALFFLKKNTALSQKRINSEIDRYTADPGQGVSYTAGFLKILELRKKAQNALGEDFDLQEFHEILLSEGIVPFFLLDQIVNHYIEKKLSEK